MSTSCSTSTVEFCPGCEPCRPPATTIASTVRNWNVDDLLGSTLLWRGIRDDRRHFHQLFCSPRSTTLAALWDPVQRDLGHGINLLVQRRRIDLLLEFDHLFPPICGTGSSRICAKGEKSTMCTTVCRRNPSCGRTSTRSVGRAASTAPSSNKLMYTVLAALGGGVVWAHGVVHLALLLSGPCHRRSPWS